MFRLCRDKKVGWWINDTQCKNIGKRWHTWLFSPNCDGRASANRSRAIVNNSRDRRSNWDTLSDILIRLHQLSWNKVTKLAYETAKRICFSVTFWLYYYFFVITTKLKTQKLLWLLFVIVTRIKGCAKCIYFQVFMLYLISYIIDDIFIGIFDFDSFWIISNRLKRNEVTMAQYLTN